MTILRHPSLGLDTAAKSTQQHSLQLAPRLRPTCAGITFEGRVGFAMKLIPISRGLSAMVDDQDYDFLNQWKWFARRPNRIHTTCVWYAVRNAVRPARGQIYMHREVLRRAGFPDAPHSDHRDTNGLNNQRHNLRPATSSQNAANVRKKAGCTSQFKGVYWHKQTRKWLSAIRCQEERHYLGLFENEIDAGRAYDAAATRFFGEFARLNFPTV